MVTLCHAMNDMEVMYIRAMLQSADVPFHIVGENFGSLYPGIQIASYNERRFLVPEKYLIEASGLISDLRDSSKESEQQENSDLTFSSKLRIVLETFIFGWSSLGGNRKTTNKSKNETASGAGTDAA